MKQVIVTTSWDDGHILDIRLAAILKKYGIAGTFYLSPKNREIKHNLLLNDQQIKQLASDFEIGSHTMTHPVMTELSLQECVSELVESKEYLEKLINKKVTSFCYPRGAFDGVIEAAVKDADYKYARTVDDYILNPTDNAFSQGTSVEAYRLSIPAFASDFRKLASYCKWNPIKIVKNIGWEQRAKTLFDDVYKNGGIFHMWGHSWVLEKACDWDKLERVLAYIGGKQEAQYLTNAQAQKMSQGK